MSDNVVLTLINQESEDLDIPGVVSKEERAVESTFIGDDLESTSDGDIEIENLVDDGLDQGGEDGGDNNPLTHITFDVRKRTLIMLWQRTILEDYYRNGMTSASMQLHSLHQAAAEKTGLDHTVVKVLMRFSGVRRGYEGSGGWARARGPCRINCTLTVRAGQGLPCIRHDLDQARVKS